MKKQKLIVKLNVLIVRKWKIYTETYAKYWPDISFKTLGTKKFSIVKLVTPIRIVRTWRCHRSIFLLSY